MGVRGSTISIAAKSFVGVPHNVKNVPIATMFYHHVTPRGGPAPVRAYLRELTASLEAGRIDPRRSSIWHCRSRMSPTATRRWTSAAPSKSFSPLLERKRAES
jgi:hypothetical protein